MSESYVQCRYAFRRFRQDDVVYCVRALDHAGKHRSQYGDEWVLDLNKTADAMSAQRKEER
jgi:hypothetical protein